MYFEVIVLTILCIPATILYMVHRRKKHNLYLERLKEETQVKFIKEQERLRRYGTPKTNDE